MTGKDADDSLFPSTAYKETVLAPLFEGAKTHYVASFRAINQAHLVMLGETGILDTSQTRAIAGALPKIDNDLDANTLTYTGEFEDYFFLVEAQLKKLVGPDLAGALHTARSRNDMDHTAFKMVLTKRLDALLEHAQALAGALIDTATREKTTLIVAYTHGQPAQPGTFGHYLGAMAEVLLRDIDRLHQARQGLELCPMGAAAITTSGFPIVRERMAQLLGFKAPTQNSYASIAAVDYITALYSALKLLFLHLGRVIQDFQFWSSFEVGQLYVPDEFVQISSIMPQKRNPVPIEHLRLLSSLTIGRCDTIVNTMHNTPFTDMNDSEGEVQQAGYGAFESGTRVLKLASALIPSLSIQEEQVRANIDKSCITVTELADTLVREDALSFRQAHEIAAVTSKAVIADDKPLHEGYQAFAKAFETVAKRPSNLDKRAFQTTVSPEHFIAVRTRYGGPAPEPMDVALAEYRDELDRFAHKTTKNKKFRADSERALGAAFARLQTR